jgi:ribonuclease R
MPRKNNKGKSDKLTTKQLEHRFTEFFGQNPSKPYNAEQLINELQIGNNKDSVQHMLQKMLEREVLMPSKSGKSFVLYDANKLGQIDDVEGQIATVTQHGKKRENEATGTVDITRSGSAFIVSADSGVDKDIYVSQNRLSNALHGDKVELRWWLSSRGRPEGEIIQVLERYAEQFIGTYTVSANFTYVVPDNPNMLYDILIDKSKPTKAQNGDKVIVGVKEWHEPKRNNFNLKGEIITVLGQSGSSDIEMQSILLEHGFALTFPDEVLRENDAIPEVITAADIQGREDFRKITTFTIDPLTAKDFDDALSYELLDSGNIKIGVHIADVSHYVTPKSALDEEAGKRTTSVYLVDRVLPMLPEKLSNGVCSLRPNEDKLTFSAVFEFTPKGDVVNEWFGRTIIHSDRRFTYEEAQEVIESKKGDFPKELALLNTFAQKLRKARFKKGALGFESSEVQFKLDETGKPIGIFTKVRKEAHFLVEEFMLLANRRVGTFIFDQFKTKNVQIPFVYRIHDLPDMEKVATFVEFAKVFGYDMKIKSPDTVSQSFGKLMKEIEGKPEQDVLQQLAIRTMSKAVYSTKNIGHYGLAFDSYSHFTSPIRRYADVLTHRILADVLAKKPIKMTAVKLEEICLHISKKERKAMESERASIKYKQVEFLQDHIGSVFEGVITGMTERGIYIEIIENRCEGMVAFSDMYDNFKLVDNYYIRSADAQHKMGDVVWVRVMSANLAKRQINMLLLAEQEEDDMTMLDAANAEKAAFKAQMESLRRQPEEEKVAEVVAPLIVAETPAKPVKETAKAKAARIKAEKEAAIKAEADAKAAAEKAAAQAKADAKAAKAQAAKDKKAKTGAKIEVVEATPEVAEAAVEVVKPKRGRPKKNPDPVEVVKVEVAKIDPNVELAKIEAAKAEAKEQAKIKNQLKQKAEIEAKKAEAEAKKEAARAEQQKAEAKKAEEKAEQLKAEAKKAEEKAEQPKAEPKKVEYIKAQPMEPQFKKAADLFSNSNAKSLSPQSQYQVAETVQLKQQAYILDYCPLIEKNKSHHPQKYFAKDNNLWQHQPAFIESAILFEEFFPEQPLDQICQIYACPFRVETEDKLFIDDINVTWPDTLASLAEQAPTRFISYSDHLRSYLMGKKLIIDLQQEYVESGNVEFLVARGFLKVGNKRVPIAFLPSLKAKVDNPARRLAWAWAVMP